MPKNLLVAQSGGPTTAINASLSGVILESLRHAEIGAVYGAVHGIQGIFDRNIIRLDTQFATADDFTLLEHTPASALGSCRFKMPTPEAGPEKYAEMLEVFRALNIGYFLYIGGNDSMDTANKIAEYCHQQREDIKVVGIPKTIDNDLPITDHTPGFGSAAKYIAVTMQEIARDADVYPVKSVLVVEIMGRNAGWLTASSVLARVNGCTAPHLIYLPETPFDTEAFLREIETLHKTQNTVVVAVSEGVRLADGSYVAEAMQSGAVDAFGHKYLSGVGKYLERLIADRLSCKVRSVEINVMQRSGAHVLSETDIMEARRAGEHGVRHAVAGESRIMIAFKRISDKPYVIDFVTAPLSDVANVEKKIPAEWITPAGNNVTADLVDYVLPLINGETTAPYQNGLPLHFVFDRTPVEF